MGAIIGLGRPEATDRRVRACAVDDGDTPAAWLADQPAAHAIAGHQRQSMATKTPRQERSSRSAEGLYL